MAEKEEKKDNKKKKGKKKGSSIAIAILVPILIVVMLAGSLLAIIDAIVQIIMEVVKAIIDNIIQFLQNPIGYISSKLAEFTNMLDRVLGAGDDFNEAEYDELRDDPSIVVSKTEFENLKNSLKDKISQNATGLDDITLKKMLLSYYRVLYLSDTNVLIELTDKEAEDDEKAEPFEIVEGDSDKNKGEDGKYYLQTKGMVTIYLNNEELIYYPEEVLKEIYQKHYLEVLEDDLEDNDEYAKDVKIYLEKCYTYGNGGIKKYVTIENEEKVTYLYENEGVPRVTDFSSDDSLQLVNIEYTKKIAQYATPIEFMIDLMEIVGSQDFLDAFIQTAQDASYIKMDLEEIKYKTVEKNVTERTRDVVVTGKKENIEYTVKKFEKDEEGKYPSDIEISLGNVAGTETGLIITETPVDGAEEVNIEVKSNEETEYKVALYANGSPNSQYGYLKEDNEYTIQWNNMSKPDQTEKNKEDTSKVIEEEIITHVEKKYDLQITEVVTWYAKITQENNIIETKTNYSKTADGEEVVVTDETEAIRIPQSDEYNEYTPDSNPDIFRDNIRNWSLGLELGVSYEDLLCCQYNYVISKPEENYSKDDYVFSKMTTNDTNVNNYTYKSVTEKSFTSGVQRTEDNTDLFLAMLSGHDNRFEVGDEFVAKEDGGVVIEYGDLYKTTAGAGELLENGAEMLFELLERSENTQGLTDIMRYIMYRYSGNNYGVTEFNFSPFDLQGISTGSSVIGESIEDKVWCSLINMGFSEYAVAGVMGNIYAESGFDPDKIENGSGIGFGLCQWSYGRRDQLEAYATAKGVPASDINTQIEFLMGELTEGGGCQRIC